MKPPEVDPRFLIDPFEPAYLKLSPSEIETRVNAGLHELEDCCACPRNCHVNRIADETKFCHTGRYARVTSVFAHHGEEDCLRGQNGSGTIFFNLCNLNCVFCQNWDISQKASGTEHPPERIATFMLQLQEGGCHNINFVTPEHVVPQVIEAIAAAILQGLKIPIVYNTGGYDSVDSLKLLDGLVDIYMPDFKFWEPKTARRLARALDYPKRAREAIAEMHRQVGDLRFGPDGVARRGLLVRHLVMPNHLGESASIFRWLSEELSPDTFVNIMGQYRPTSQVGELFSDGTPKYGEIERRPTSEEMDRAYKAARDAGLWRFDKD